MSLNNRIPEMGSAADAFCKALKSATKVKLRDDFHAHDPFKIVISNDHDWQRLKKLVLAEDSGLPDELPDELPEGVSVCLVHLGDRKIYTIDETRLTHKVYPTLKFVISYGAVEDVSESNITAVATPKVNDFFIKVSMENDNGETITDYLDKTLTLSSLDT